MTRPRKKSRRKRDSNPGPSALEADALTTRPTRRCVETGRWCTRPVRGPPLCGPVVKVCALRAGDKGRESRIPWSSHSSHLTLWPLCRPKRPRVFSLSPPLCLPVCLYSHVAGTLSNQQPTNHLSVCHSRCLSPCLSLSFCLILFLFLCLSVCLSVSLSLSLAVSFFLSVSVFLSFSVCLCLSLSLSLSLAPGSVYFSNAQGLKTRFLDQLLLCQVSGVIRSVVVPWSTHTNDLKTRFSD